MQDLLNHGLQWLRQERESHMSASVTYVRGLARIEDMPATIAQTTFSTTRHDGVAIEVKSRDFIVNVERLVFDDERTLPVAGDRIEETDEYGELRVYELLPLGDSPGWRFSDVYHRVLRIHTKEIGKEEE